MKTLLRRFITLHRPVTTLYCSFSAHCCVPQRRYTSTANDLIATQTQLVANAAATVEQLERIVDMRQADVNAVVKYLVSKGSAKPPLPQSADEVTRLLWLIDWNMDVLKTAKDDLYRAKGDVKTAKDGLYRAEDKLKTATDELKTAKDKLKEQPLSEEELASSLKEFITDSIQNLSTAEPQTYDVKQRFDTGLIQQQISSLIQHVECAKARQDTRTGVLLSSSGVGKTYTALTYPTREHAIDGKVHVTLYLGFNSGCPLTDTEQCFLKDEYTVAAIVLGRLVACLAVLSKEGYPERAPDSDVHRIVPTVSCNVLIDKLLKSCRPLPGDKLVSILHDKAIELLVSLQKSKNQPVAVLLNIDEAQEFDKVTMGVKFALRHLRRLQLEVVTRTDGACVPLGFATGINPNFTLLNASEGINQVIEGPIMTWPDFERLALTFVVDKRTKECCLSVAAVVYPRARSLVRFLKESVEYIPVITASKDECIMLLDAFIRGAALPREMIPPWCVSWGVKGTDRRDVYIDYCIWEAMMTCYDPTVSEVVKRPVKEMLPTGDRAHFAEDCFGRIVYTVLHLMFRPLPGLEAAAAHYRKGKGAALQAALRLGTKDCISMQRYDGVPNDAKQNYHPFQHASSHEEAYQSKKLSEGFKTCISGLTEPGTSVLFACGGSAPIDFILVRRNDAGELVMWYADSKSHKAGNQGAIRREARDIAKKALSVHWGIIQACGTTSINISPYYTVSVLTNAVMTKNEIQDVEQQTRLPVDLSQHASLTWEELKNLLKDDDNVASAAPGVKVLCPTNFAFDPLTPILYRAIDEHAFLQGLGLEPLEHAI